MRKTGAEYQRAYRERQKAKGMSSNDTRMAIYGPLVGVVKMRAQQMGKSTSEFACELIERSLIEMFGGGNS